MIKMIKQTINYRILPCCTAKCSKANCNIKIYVFTNFMAVCNHHKQIRYLIGIGKSPWFVNLNFSCTNNFLFGLFLGSNATVSSHGIKVLNVYIDK